MPLKAKPFGFQRHRYLVWERYKWNKTWIERFEPKQSLSRVLRISTMVAGGSSWKDLLSMSGSQQNTGNNTTVVNRTVTNTIHTGRGCEVPKLRSNKCDDYTTWKVEVEGWTNLTKIDRDQQVPHITMNGILDRETKEVAITIPRDVATSGEGPKRLLQILDKNFMTTPSERKWKHGESKKHGKDRWSVMVWLHKENAQVEARFNWLRSGNTGGDILHCLIEVEISTRFGSDGVVWYNKQ